MLRDADNPPMLPAAAAESGPAGLAGPWWVAHTKARAEKAVAWDLHGRGVGYFLPMAGRTAMWGGRRRTVQAVIFPSYLFFSGSADDRATVLATGRVCQVIEVRQQEQLVGELQSVYGAVGAKMRLDPYPFAAVGRRCRVARGAMRGVEGVVVQKDDGLRLVLRVSLLGQSVALHVTGDLLEPAE